MVSFAGLLFRLLLAAGAALHAVESTDLPRNEEVESVFDSSILVLSEIPCPAVDSILHRFRLCQECMLLKVNCPNTCLASPSASQPFEAVKCAPRDDPYGTDPNFNCRAAFRFDESCVPARFTAPEWSLFLNLNTPNIPRGQRRGCPGLTADPASSPVEPLFPGCGPYLSTFEGTDMFLPVGAPPVYQRTADYSDFVFQCVADADGRESCAKRSAICRRQFNNSGCVLETCKKRVSEWEKRNQTVLTVSGGTRECHMLATADCLKLSKLARNCLNGVNQDCFNCFRKVYPDDRFQYRFVAKSGQKAIFLWKLHADVAGSTSQSAYFYSKIQVEDAAGVLVYSSPVHQKVFEGSFSIFSTIAVPPSLLRTGEEYFARLYYFIATDPGLDLKMRTSGAEITAIKVRE
ncbi:MAG: hypothetical protein HYZ75_08340 [Elusimicrobia bacterium]|nr:hypothetical protein [Elusimicrobiota bacterium]